MAEIKWYKVFASEKAANLAIPINGLRKANLLGKKYCLGRNTEGFFATDDRCPHMNASMSQGRLNAFGEILCPLHDYRFNLKSGREADQKCEDLAIHRMEIRSDGVYLGILQ